MSLRITCGQTNTCFLYFPIQKEDKMQDKKETEHGLHTFAQKSKGKEQKHFADPNNKNLFVWLDISFLELQSNVCMFFCTSHYSNKISAI